MLDVAQANIPLCKFNVCTERVNISVHTYKKHQIIYTKYIYYS